MYRRKECRAKELCGHISIYLYHKFKCIDAINGSTERDAPRTGIEIRDWEADTPFGSCTATLYRSKTLVAGKRSFQRKQDKETQKEKEQKSGEGGTGGKSSRNLVAPPRTHL